MLQTDAEYARLSTTLASDEVKPYGSNQSFNRSRYFKPAAVKRAGNNFVTDIAGVLGRAS
jgi:hypothetical protein